MSRKSSIDSGGSKKLSFLVEISRKMKNLKKYEIVEKGAPALRVIQAGTRLTVHRSLP